MAAPWTAVAQVRIIGEMHGSQTVNVMHFATNTVINDEAGRNTLLQQLLVALLACVVEFLLPAVTSDWRLIRLDAKNISTGSDAETTLAPEAAAVGTLSPASASFISTLLNVKTGGGGRSGRGKKFLPPPGEAECTASSIDPGTVALILAFVNCVLAKFVGGAATTEWRFGILSTKLLKAVGGTTDNSFREATSIVVNPVLAKMGSRKKGVGA